ncbi:uncharacterized protein DUF4145 [Frondihabitans sp. PhB188]|uniref:DUF4145 domain-containing protein n=1 Tax=Frondihabitans sp. PhB188 TaxID=2485200 RepID=UPI000F47C036|nr:DUF4145 domain-containing protein [Frondihabitans sp. PhB188]ROQ40961.1 uncharacterized protein DUF4145 [Frondihabitans sp. PhB188]
MANKLSAADRAPARNKPRFDCPHCGAYASQTWFKLYRDVGSEDYGHPEFELVTDGKEIGLQLAAGPGTPIPFPSSAEMASAAAEAWLNKSRHPGEWMQSLCTSCEDYATWRSEDLIYPGTSITPPPSEDMPEDVAALYEEARAVVSVSRRAGAALARATMEALIKRIDPDAPKPMNLDNRIARIIPTVSSSLGQMLTVIRHVGNKTLHVEENPDAATRLVLDETQTEIVDLIFQSINDLVDERITRPLAAASVLRLVPESVRSRVPGLADIMEGAPGNPLDGLGTTPETI